MADGPYVVMGVSGCGKTTVASELARLTHGEFLDGDDFHSAANRAKMTSGIPLEDGDRAGWLASLNGELKSRAHSPKKTFLACSALKQAYRDRLAEGLSGIRFIYLQGTKECLLERIRTRDDHFMPPSLLESQFAILEEPKNALTVSVGQPPESVVLEILRKLEATSPRHDGGSPSWSDPEPTGGV
jgi:carbohydrate kinase (thermoresistant glucokinase family)